MNTYSITWHDAGMNHDVYYQVKRNGEDIAAFDTRAKAEKYVDDLKHTIVLRTKKIDSYFRGILKKGYFPIDGKEKWFVACESYSGGKPPILSVIDFKANSKTGLLTMLRTFKKKHNLVLELTKFS